MPNVLTTDSLLSEQFKFPGARMVQSANLEYDLKVTSLDQVELVMRVEDDFKVEISHRESSQLKTVGDLLALVERKMRAGAWTH